ncbi:MAG: ABC transporter permease [Chloroflexi bacterium]|nr:ABC transporter permease [Chloroflexota bacterium]
MFLVSVLIFFISEVVPLDVARNILGQFATEEAVEYLRKEMGLDKPVYLRYFKWISGFVTGDLGKSTLAGTPVLPIIIRRTTNSLMLAVVAFSAIMPLAVVLGVLAGINAGKLIDRIVSIGGLVTVSTPEFASGTFLILIFSLWLGLLPGSSAMDRETYILQSPQKLVLPIMVLMLADVGYVARMTRASVAEVMRTAYVRTAILKGLPYWQVIFKHALRNALLAPITVIMLHINWLVGGMIIVETVFGYPGVGKLMLEAAMNKDVPVIEAAAMVFTIVAVGSQMIADIAYTYLNPRIRFA